MKLTLTQITRFDKDKEGKPLMTKDGRPYTRLLIRAKEYGDQAISGFDSIQTQNWREGDEVEVEVEKKGEYLNFKVPNKQDLIGKQLEQIQNVLAKHTLMLTKIGQTVVPKEKDDYPEASDGEIPF